jgi:F-type H+-transporting ATPase subunit b
MKKILLLITLSSFLFSSSLEGTDFIPRLVNFLIFAGIIYYLIADKIKDALNSRTTEIQTTLTQAQEKLSQSKKQKLQASNKAQESEKMSLDIIKVAKEDCKVITKKYKEQTKQSIISMKKVYEDRIDLEARQARIQSTQEILNSLIDDSLDSLSQEQIINIINKKVA